MNQQVHIIHRVNLEIETPDKRSAIDLQEEALRLLYNEILPRLEKWLDSLMTSGRLLRIDYPDHIMKRINREHFGMKDIFIRIEHLDLTLNKINRELFEKQFADNVIISFNESIENILSPHSEISANEPEAKHLFLLPATDSEHLWIWLLAE